VVVVQRSSEEMQVGIVATFEPEDDSPVRELPWGVTFRPSGDEGEWDSFTCGPYRREHAVQLAETVALEVDGVYALVEPLFPALDADTVTAAIQERREEAAESDGEDFEDEIVDGDSAEIEETPFPSHGEVRAGMEGVMRKLLSFIDEAAAK
jgi:hypothetical protein